MATNETSAARLRRAAEGGTRRSGAGAVMFLGVALVAGLAAALLATRYLERRTTAQRMATAKVVVASLELPLATTLRAEHLKAVDWPQNAVPPGAIQDPVELAGRVLIEKVSEGEPILKSKLASRDAGSGLAAVIPPSMRAVAVRVDDVVGVAGFIQPGDHVDVLVTMKPKEVGEVETTSKVFLQNVRVLAVGKDLDTQEGSRRNGVPVTVATLMVTPEQSESLALAAVRGRLLLALRSGIDTAEVATPGAIPPTLFAGIQGEPRAATPVAVASGPARRPAPPRTARVAATPAAPTPPPRREDVVEVIRGNRFEERTFQRGGE